MADFGNGVFSVKRVIAAATTNATLAKASPGQVGGFFFTNSAAYAVYVKLYDSATIPTAGAGTPIATIGCPATTSDSVALPGGLQFGAGIGFTITKLVADNDTTVLVANDVILNLLYA